VPSLKGLGVSMLSRTYVRGFLVPPLPGWGLLGQRSFFLQASQVLLIFC